MKNEEKSLISVSNAIFYGVLAFIIGASITAAIFGFTWPKRIAKLKDGTEPVVELNKEKITADDLYDKLKNTVGVSSLTEMIDQKILHSKYEEKDADDYAQEMVDYTLDYYKKYGYDEAKTLEAAGFDTKDKMYKYYKEYYYYLTYVNDAAKKELKEEEIKSYYKTSVFGKKTFYIFYSTEKGNQLVDARQAIKKGTKPNKIESKYNVKVLEQSDVLYTDDTYSKEFIKNLASLKSGEYSNVFKDENYGSVFIYVVNSEDKPEYNDEVKDNIAGILIKDKVDEKYYYQTIIKMREENGLMFYDSELEKEYKQSIKKYE